MKPLFVPQSLAELQALPAQAPTAIVEFLEADSRFNIRQGDKFEACPYRMDTGKWTLLKRVGDGFQPECNAYRSQVKIIAKF